MKIIVTGSEGFIGRNLVEALKPEHDVFGIDKKSGNDITLINWVDTDLIVHLAAQTSTKESVEYPEQDFLDNAYGTLCVLEGARESGAGIIYAGTRKSYTPSLAPYGLSKLVGEEYVYVYNQQYDVPYIVNILGNTYGPGQNGSPKAFWLDHLIKCKLNDETFTIYGHNGEQTRDMLYIDDLIDLLVKQIDMFDKVRNKVFQVGGGDLNEISINEAIEYIGHEKVEHGPSLPADTKYEVTRDEDLFYLKEHYDWEPTTYWQEGINKTIKAYGNI